MREIKFRAWEKSFKKMYKDVIPHKFYNGESFILMPNGYNKIDTIGSKIVIETEMLGGDFLFMQYTGLKDKINTEIYHGDILENKNYIGSIKFSAPEFYLDLIHGKSSIIRDGSRWTIIGNIYENPELLEVNQ